MANRNNLGPVKIISAASMGGDVTGPATNIQFIDNIAIQLNFTGTPTGDFKIQGSSDHQEVNGVVTNEGNWVDITLSPSPAAAGAADNILINMTQLAFPFIRVFYDRSSGTGSLDAWISGKAI